MSENANPSRPDPKRPGVTPTPPGRPGKPEPPNPDRPGGPSPEHPIVEPPDEAQPKH